MLTYRIKPGKRHGPRDEFGPGDLVKLTEYEASGFLDKMELVVEEPVPEESLSSMPPADEPPAPAEKKTRKPPAKGKSRAPVVESVAASEPEISEPLAPAEFTPSGE